MSEFACVLSAAIGFIAGVVIAAEAYARIQEDDTDAER